MGKSHQTLLKDIKEYINLKKGYTNGEMHNVQNLEDSIVQMSIAF